MKTPAPQLTLFVLFSLFFLPPVLVHASSPPADSVQFCAPFDYEQWRRDHPLPAAKRAADLNVGEPRTVRMIYFLPNDRPFRQEVVDSMKVRIRRIQTFYAEPMQAHGYGDKTFQFETDAQGEPLVHHVDGQHPDSHYLDNTSGTVLDEVYQVFDRNANIYLIQIDNGANTIGTGGGIAGGVGDRLGRNSGFAVVPDRVHWNVVAHELGHAFGLLHDFRDTAYLMSYGSASDRLSACSAEFLAVHPYFNSDSPAEGGQSPTIELLSPRAYPAESESVLIQLQFKDPEGLHQAILFAWQTGFINDYEVLECRGLAGKKEAVVEFEYDGVIPSGGGTSLSDIAAHRMVVGVVDTDGNVREENYVLTEVSSYLSATLMKHTGEVNSVSFSRDGTLLASASADRTVILWDVAKREETGTLTGHTGAVNSASFSPDGTLLASGSTDGTVILWDLAKREDRTTLTGHTDGVNSVSFSPDEILASGSADGTVILWDLAKKEDTATLTGHASAVNSLSFSRDGTILASGAVDGKIKLWDVRNRGEIATVDWSTHGLTSIAVSPDGATLASGSLDGWVWVWDVLARKPIAQFAHLPAINSVAFSRDGATLSAAGRDGRVILWDVLTRKELATFAHTSEIHSVAFSRDGAILASGSRDGAVILWDTSGWTRPRPFALEILSGDGQQGAPGAALARPLVVEVRDQYGNPLPGATVTFTVTADEGKLSDGFTVEHATTDANGRAAKTLTIGRQPGVNTVEVSIGGRELARFHAEGVGTAVAELEGDYRTWHLPRAATARLGKGALGEGDRAVAFSPDGCCLAVASGIGVWLYDAATARALALLPTESPVNSVAFSLVGTLAAALENSRVELWEVETGERIGTLYGSGHRVAFSPDGSLLASGGQWNVPTVWLWDVAAQREVASFEGGPPALGSVSSLAFSPDGTILASGGSDGKVRLWDLATQKEMAALTGHTDNVTSVVFSRDGTLISGSWDSRIKLWDVAAQREVATLPGHADQVTSVAVSPDGATLVSGGTGHDTTAKLWDLVKRELIAILEERTHWVTSVAFSPNGVTVASGGSQDGTVLLRDVETGNAVRISGHNPLSSMVFSPDGATLASRSSGGIRLWDAVSQTRIATLEGYFPQDSPVSFSSDGALLATGSWDGIELWDVASKTQIATLEAHSGLISWVAFSPVGATLASGTRNGMVKLWDVATQTEIATLRGHTGRVASGSFSSDGATIASGSYDGTVKLWDAATQTEIATLRGHTGRVASVAFSCDDSLLAVGARTTVRSSCGTWPHKPGSPRCEGIGRERGRRRFRAMTPCWLSGQATVRSGCGTWRHVNRSPPWRGTRIWSIRWLFFVTAPRWPPGPRMARWCCGILRRISSLGLPIPTLIEMEPSVLPTSSGLRKSSVRIRATRDTMRVTTWMGTARSGLVIF